ncbi:MAG: S49 family peptidase [Rubrivivax sp.]
MGGDTAKLAVASKLVDALKTRDEAQAPHRARRRGHRGEDVPAGVAGRVPRATSIRTRARRLGEAIGVIVAQGEIVDGRAGPGTVGGLSTAEQIRKAREADDARRSCCASIRLAAALAGSELVRRELELARAAGKPAVSMGDVAASGGYWISMAADEVIADEATTTGSIGVVGMMPSAEEALGKLGIHSAGTTTTWLAGAMDELRKPEPRLGGGGAVDDRPRLRPLRRPRGRAAQAHARAGRGGGARARAERQGRARARARGPARQLGRRSGRGAPAPSSARRRDCATSRPTGPAARLLAAFGVDEWRGWPPRRWRCCGRESDVGESSSITGAMPAGTVAAALPPAATQRRGSPNWAGSPTWPRAGAFRHRDPLPVRGAVNGAGSGAMNGVVNGAVIGRVGRAVAAASLLAAALLAAAPTAHAQDEVLFITTPDRDRGDARTGRGERARLRARPRLGRRPHRHHRGEAFRCQRLGRGDRSRPRAQSRDNARPASRRAPSSASRTSSPPTFRARRKVDDVPAAWR